jgi:hypothetical protein
MVTLNFVLAGMLVGSIIGAVYFGVLNYRRHKLNMQMAQDLDVVLRTTMDVVKRNKEGGANLSLTNAEMLTVEELYKNVGDPDQDISSPQMLSTILTVLVHKYGSMSLALKDFMKVPEDEYISVYVNTTSKELILSMDHDMGTKSPTTMVNFTNSDDNTFH